MKRILVLDNSEAARETLAFLLARDFVVEKDAAGLDSGVPGEIPAHFDLVILGVPAQARAQGARLVQWARTVRCPVLFLVDSSALAQTFAADERCGCLTIPFDPYRLREEAERLCSASEKAPPAASLSAPISIYGSRCVEYPLVSRANATLAQRFASAGFPVLVFGELGCGQERVARALATMAQCEPICISGAEVGEKVLGELEQKLASRTLSGANPVSLIFSGVDRLAPSAQELLFNFLIAQDEKLPRRQILSTADEDLLRRVYGGRYLAPLYFRLATLTLKLAPLRERRAEIAVIAQHLADTYAPGLNLGAVSFSASARERLENYLWFGNLSELETVIARTLATHRKAAIEAPDLIFELGHDMKISPVLQQAPASPQRTAAPVGRDAAQTEIKSFTSAPVNGASAPMPDLRVFVHELAHEIKNPMVTIKTFAQLLTDRYQDEGFRARYKEVVDEDIGRIDQLLEVMIEFANFGAPQRTEMALAEQIRESIREMTGQFVDRQVPIEWQGNNGPGTVHADEAQVRYILKNLLVVAMNQAKAGTQITVDTERPGEAIIAYTGEGNRAAAVPAHLGASPGSGDDSLPLRILLAKQLAERNDGTLKLLPQGSNEKNAIELAFPVV